MRWFNVTRKFKKQFATPVLSSENEIEIQYLLNIIRAEFPIIPRDRVESTFSHRFNKKMPAVKTEAMLNMLKKELNICK